MLNINDFNKQTTDSLMFHLSKFGFFDFRLKGIIFFNGKYNIFVSDPENTILRIFYSGDLLDIDNEYVEINLLNYGCLNVSSILCDKNGIYLCGITHYNDNGNNKMFVSIFYFTNNKMTLLSQDLITDESLVDTDEMSICDPFLFKRAKYFYLILAAKSKTENLGKLIFFKSDNLIGKYKFEFEIGPLQLFGEKISHPNFVSLEDYDFIIFERKYESDNFSSLAYISLDMDFLRKEFKILKIDILENSLNLSCPILFTSNEDKLEIMAEFIKDQKSLSLTYPRIIENFGSNLIQKPIPEIKKLIIKQNKYIENQEIPIGSLIKVIAHQDFKISFNDKKTLEILFFEGALIVKNCDDVIRSKYKYKDISLFIFIDFNTMEIFINHGQEVLSFATCLNADKFPIYIMERDHIDSLVIAETKRDERK